MNGCFSQCMERGIEKAFTTWQTFSVPPIVFFALRKCDAGLPRSSFFVFDPQVLRGLEWNAAPRVRSRRQEAGAHGLIFVSPRQSRPALLFDPLLSPER